MTKSIMNSILTLIATMDSDEAVAVRDAITAELAKGEAKAKANRDMYTDAIPIVLGALSATTPVTIGELYDEIKNYLPDGFTKGKVQYLVTRMLTDKIEKHEGKINAYTLKA